jgi:cytidylate kinase
MRFDPFCNRNVPMQTPEFADTAQSALPSLPDRFLNVPWADMPEKMLITIDGWDDTPKGLVGEWVANSFGGLLINSEKIFTALFAGACKSGIDVNDHFQVESWCEQAAVDIGFDRNGGRALEGQIAVNGYWFKESELQPVSDLVSNRAAQHAFRSKVRQVVRRCDFTDRVVLVGSDIGYQFPFTPYKFFLDKVSDDRNPTELAALAYPWAGDAGRYEDSGVTYFERMVNTLMIETSHTDAPNIVCVVLVESVARACEMGFISGKRELVLGQAYFLADATRRRMTDVLSRSSK